MSPAAAVGSSWQPRQSYALFHYFVRKDNVLGRMVTRLPRWILPALFPAEDVCAGGGRIR
jgi:hypothetical protein